MSEQLASAEALIQSWTKNAGAWTTAIRTGAIESRRVTNRAVVEAVLARQPQKILDLGCGEGWLARDLSGHGIDYVGMDGSPALIEAAQSAGGGTFHVCSYADFAADPRRLGEDFDVVVANFSLLNENISPLLRSLRSVLAASGALIIQTLHPWATGGAYRNGWREENFSGFDGAWQPMPWYFRTLGGWLELLRENGYVVADLCEPKYLEAQAPLSMLLVVETSVR